MHNTDKTDIASGANSTARKYRVFTRRQLDQIPQIKSLSLSDRWAMNAVAAVLPFRVNNYVIEELIDWSKIPDDPMYQLTFPQPGMLSPEDFQKMYRLVREGAPDEVLMLAARDVQRRLNPHPAGQLELNVPKVGGQPIPGIQHKYKETVLFFPAAGQTCHAYCTYCFRWAQFVGMSDLKFAAKEAGSLASYLRSRTEVSSVLLTGGDPLVMKTALLSRYIEPLLEPDLEHVESIRIGTKAPAYWPYRFTTDSDADDLLRLIEKVANSNRHIAIMVHYSHPIELESPAAQEAVRRLRDAGATVRCQAPLIRGVNDDAATWVELWRRQIRLGAVPYYMFVERDTGPKDYFSVPLARAFEIFNEAYSQVSGLGRTVRGPSMSATPGKVLVDGISEIYGERVFVLKFLQARNPDWVGRPFFAKYDEEAIWLDDLVPAFDEDRFFFEQENAFSAESRPAAER
ncbi:MAG: lysine 2,3-aminomutase [Gemmatimonadota bacterium]|nr:lysine 2,3-aminomutase [Gemmatimonadota bacterium]MDH5805565.1 lysine 2,3-aminomutase [Gemmatimonadota bacterium]